MNNLSQLKIGDGITVKMYSDTYACTIIKITKTMICVQRDNSTLLNGVDSGESDALTFSPGGFVGHTEGQQRYKYSKNPQGAIYKLKLRKDGKYYLVNSVKNRAIAGRFEYYDFNF